MNPTRWAVLCKFILNMPNFAKLDELPRLVDLAPNNFWLFQKKIESIRKSYCTASYCKFLTLPEWHWLRPEDGWGLGWWSTCLPVGRFQRHSKECESSWFPGLNLSEGESSHHQSCFTDFFIRWVQTLGLLHTIGSMLSTYLLTLIAFI